MNFSYYIAKRYLFSPGGSNAINIITGIAAAGVVIAAMSLFIVLCGFAGLKYFSLEYTSYFDPDLKIFPANGKTIILTKELENKLKKVKGIAHYSKIVEERVFLDFKSKPYNLASIKGVDTAYGKVIVTDSVLVSGTWVLDNDAMVVIGNGIRRSLSIGIDDYQNILNIYVPRPGKGIPKNPSKAINRKGVISTGVYSVNEELDEKYVFASIGLARDLLDLKDNEITNIEFKLAPEASETVVRHGLQLIFGDSVVVKNRVQLNDTLYKMLNTENLIAYLILTLVAIIALFNVAGSIIMMIIDKKSNIKTLYNLGATIPGIRKIFLLQGSLMTVLGTLLGLLIGVVVILSQQQFGLLMITSHLPYPTKIETSSLITVFFTITIIGIVAALLASSRINQRLVS